ncbi:MAG TPA: hypothetical protein PK788_11690 [Gemmatimonadaceae bacterium]|mgnify:CR=1 FL=1|nr:hypothetical protein [Gemmatimonadaceae bacterium]
MATRKSKATPKAVGPTRRPLTKHQLLRKNLMLAMGWSVVRLTEALNQRRKKEGLSPLSEKSVGLFIRSDQFKSTWLAENIADLLGVSPGKLGWGKSFKRRDGALEGKPLGSA